MIYHVTYLSGGLRVKGYLGIPNEYELSNSALIQLLQQFNGSLELPIKKFADSIHQHQVDVQSVKLPALIYCRGGIGKVGMVKTQWIEQFASYGYIVFAPSYRGTEDGDGKDEFGGADNEDVLAAYRLLQSLPFVDSDQISVMGFSRGAINAAHMAAQSVGIHKLILWSGVSDMATTYEQRIDLRRMLKRVIGGTPAKLPDSYLYRSPIHMAEQIHCPVLIMHGTLDIQVDYSQGLNMYNQMCELGANVDMHTYEGYGHHFPAPVHDQAVRRMFEWIENDSNQE